MESKVTIRFRVLSLASRGKNAGMWFYSDETTEEYARDHIAALRRKGVRAKLQRVTTTVETYGESED